MELVFVGVGSAFTSSEYYHSNILARAGELTERKQLLIDCGSDARHSLRCEGITNENVGQKIDAVYISHIHMDHMGGLEWLGFCSFFNPEAERPKLYIAADLVAPLWNSLRCGMEWHQDRRLTLEDFFDVRPIQDWFAWGGAKFHLVRTYHIRRPDGSYVPSYGLFIEGPAKTALITTDTCVHEGLMSYYREARYIFHDCETGQHKSGVHAHYDDLKDLPHEIRQKMWLYHYYPNPEQKPATDGFADFVRRRDTFFV